MKQLSPKFLLLKCTMVMLQFFLLVPPSDFCHIMLILIVVLKYIFLFLQGIETSLIGATHAHAVSALRSTGDQVTLIVLSAGSVPPVAKTAPLYSSTYTTIYVYHITELPLSNFHHPPLVASISYIVMKLQSNGV